MDNCTCPPWIAGSAELCDSCRKEWEESWRGGFVILPLGARPQTDQLTQLA